jgi:hypothetical protein
VLPACRGPAAPGVTLWCRAPRGDLVLALLAGSAARLLIGAGQYGTVTVSKEAAAHLERNGCQVELLSTPEAIPAWNQAEGAVIAMLHVTC